MTMNLIEVKENVFHLHNGLISYILSVEDGGLLAHLYFGKYVNQYHGERHYPRMDRSHSGNLPEATDRLFSKDTLLQEYSGNNTGDNRLPACVIRTANGARTVDFRYVGYQIINGKPNISGLPHAYVENDQEAQTLVVTMRDATIDAKLVLYYTIYRDRQVITRHVELKNESSSSFSIEKIASMQMDLPKQNLDVISLPGSYARERQIERQPLRRGLTQFESRRGSSSHHMNPFVALVAPNTNEFDGEALGVMLVYSGNHQMSLESDQVHQTRLMAGISDYNFDWQLADGATFTTPEVLMTYTDHGLNGMSQAFHSLLRERVATSKHKLTDRPIVINNWEATYFDFNTAKLKQIIDSAASCNIEMFVLDDGWFGHRDNDKTSLGDWFVNTQKLPGGLEEVADYTHDKGMQFGLWFEPECISEDSDLYRQHPDYVLGVPNRGRTISRDEYVLDFSRPEVVDNIYQQMTKILDHVSVDYIKWDFNRNLTEVFSNTVTPEHEGETTHRYVLGLYSLMEKLTKRYPDILFEGCSGGGGRFDDGIMYYMPQSWPSDNNDPIERLKIQYGTSLAYPISAITAHVGTSPDELLGRYTSMDMRGAVAASGTLGYELDTSKLAKEDTDKIREQVSFYKQHRHLIQYGNFYRLESPFESNHVAWMFVSPDQNEVLLFNFVVLSQIQNDFHLTKLIGLDANKQYTDTESQMQFGGDELMNVGLYDQPIQSSDFSANIRYFIVKNK